MTVNSIFELKDKIQREALNEWYKKGCKGTMQIATGVGKTRIGVLASSYFAKKSGLDYKILILTPTETIRDYSWRDEFTTWGEELVYNNCVKTVCINTAYKLNNEFFDLVIADEIHNYIPDLNNTDYEFYKFFENNKFDKILGLSAKIPYMKYHYLNKIAPICYNLSTDKAVELGIVSPYKIYTIPIPLTEEERKLYSYYSVGITKSREKGGQGWGNVGKRIRLLTNTQSKLDFISNIIPLFKDKYGLVFSLDTSYADRITKCIGDYCKSFHSKVSKKCRKILLDTFYTSESEVKILSTVKALNEGANIPGISFALVAGFDSKDLNVVQRIGRIIRFEENKEAIMIFLYHKDTVEERWMNKALYNYKPNHLKSVEELKGLLVSNSTFIGTEHYENEEDKITHLRAIGIIN